MNTHPGTIESAADRVPLDAARTPRMEELAHERFSPAETPVLAQGVLQDELEMALAR